MQIGGPITRDCYIFFKQVTQSYIFSCYSICIVINIRPEGFGMRIMMSVNFFNNNKDDDVDGNYEKRYLPKPHSLPTKILSKSFICIILFNTFNTSVKLFLRFSSKETETPGDYVNADP